ncbi:MAG TPA: YhcH/YjgK/YiaL family protein [Opitutus sp.]|nr:YhcH/YjgK/YiaL family protein [Opitutus sp.]
MALIGSLATVRSQAFPVEKFAAAFMYLDELFRAESPSSTRLRTIAIGETQRIELSGGAFALEQVYRSKARCDGFFESHRNYIDVQVVFEGEEWMELIDLNRASIRHAYDPQRDLLIYADAPGSLLRVNTGDAAVFYPADVHMPGLCGGPGPALVRKTVIKIPVGAS